MYKKSWYLRWLLCWAFGHTGIYTDSGYHICDRCGLHGYWSFRETGGPDVRPEYGNSGHLIGWYWRLKQWRQERRWRSGKDEIPF